jgi:hypothetical protein
MAGKEPGYGERKYVQEVRMTKMSDAADGLFTKPSIFVSPYNGYAADVHKRDAP